MDIIPFNQSVSNAQQMDNLPPVISKLADVDPRAEIGGGVVIGPFCVVGPNVRIGAGTRLLNNVSVLGHVTMGRECVVHPGAVVGGGDLKSFIATIYGRLKFAKSVKAVA